MGRSNIEWTEETWNPTVGCHKVSPGCKHCYAEVMHSRLTAMGQAKYADPFRTVKPWPAQLADPLSWRKPRRVFVNSMSDLFHEDVSFNFIDRVFAVMALTPQHTYQVLTKRADRMREYATGRTDMVGPAYRQWQEHHGRVGMRDSAVCVGTNPTKWPLPNVWLGVSAEDQERADERVPHLIATPAAVRFVSYEPALGPVDFNEWLHREQYARRHNGVIVDRGGPGQPRIDWLIVGGESGPGARPFDLAWARSAVRQCREAGVACFVKQLGAAAVDAGNGIAGARLKVDPDGAELVTRRLKDAKGGDIAEWPEALRVRQFPEARDG